MLNQPGDRVMVPYKIIDTTVSCNPEDMETIQVDALVDEEPANDAKR